MIEGIAGAAFGALIIFFCLRKEAARAEHAIDELRLLFAAYSKHCMDPRDARWLRTQLYYPRTDEEAEQVSAAIRAEEYLAKVDRGAA